MRAAAIGPALIAFLLSSACEQRIEEPRSAARQGSTAPPSAAAPSAPRTAVPTACVRPTPEQPTRMVEGSVPAPGCPDDPDPMPVLPRGKVTFPEATGGPTVAVEIAETDEHRQRGLMYRKSMPAEEGMLFVFERTKKLSFWMRNTCIPLDMVFVAEDLTIVNIEENVPTLTDRTFASHCPARYVVELNAGWARAHGLKAGQKLAIAR